MIHGIFVFTWRNAFCEGALWLTIGKLCPRAVTVAPAAVPFRAGFSVLLQASRRAPDALVHVNERFLHAFFTPDRRDE
ncbi:hypothetical protein [Caballeronia sp. J97]|uniref:hypothetical protein n=1 Tax=Caballeronia sp. J97 TaxID=2805429 RepID=UPI002AB2A443|nr:hypothetical protein [Caballeronia sp. J97]